MSMAGLLCRLAPSGPLGARASTRQRAVTRHAAVRHGSAVVMCAQGNRICRREPTDGQAAARRLAGSGSVLRGGDLRRRVDGHAPRSAMPGHERRAGDDESEGDEAGRDLERARADRLVEDEDAADDGGEVGGHGGEGDHLDGRPELEAARGGVERDRARDERGERPRAQQPMDRASGWVRNLIARLETPNSAPAPSPSRSPLALRRTLWCAGIARTAAATATIAPSTAIIAARDERCGLVAPTATIQPIANHRELNRPAALPSGCRTRIGGASTSSRCLSRKATLVASAETKCEDHQCRAAETPV
jgi:hypothetical protein